VVGEGAAVLYDVHPGGGESRRHAVVADPELEPDDPRGRPHGEQLLDVRGQRVRRAKDVDEVDRSVELAEVPAADLAPEALAGEARQDRGALPVEGCRS